MNVPIGIAAMILTAAVAPNPRSGRRDRLDLLGTALVTLALLLITYGLIEGEPRSWGNVWGPITIPMLIAAGLIALAIFLGVERARQDREPLLPFAILRNRNFALMSVVVAALPCSVMSLLFLTSIYLQSALGMSVLRTGLMMAVAPGISIVFALLSGRLTDRLGGKYVLVIGLVLFAAGIACLAAVTRAHSAWWELLPGLITFGVGMGVVYAPPATLAMYDIAPSMSGVASGVFSTNQRLGSLLGSTAVGALLQARLTVSLQTAKTYPEGLAEAIRLTFALPITVLMAAIVLTLAVKSPSPVHTHATETCSAQQPQP